MTIWRYTDGSSLEAETLRSAWAECAEERFERKCGEAGGCVRGAICNHEIGPRSGMAPLTITYCSSNLHS
jgi:hypothetical protein